MNEFEKLVDQYRATQRKQLLKPKCPEIEKKLSMLERSIDKILNQKKTNGK